METENAVMDISLLELFMAHRGTATGTQSAVGRRGGRHRC